MSVDGDWRYHEEIDQHDLRLGRIFQATIERRGGDSIYAKRWIGTLNTDLIEETSDIEYAKARIDWEIVTRLHAIRDGFARIKRRAPSSSDLFPIGAFERWKTMRLVEPIYLDLSALKKDPEA